MLRFQGFLVGTKVKIHPYLNKHRYRKNMCCACCYILCKSSCAHPTHLAEIMDWWKMPSLEEDKMHPRLELVHRVQHNLTRLAVCFMSSRLIPLVSFHIMLLFVRRRDKMCLHHLIKLIVRQFHLLKGHNLDVEDC